MEFVCLEWQCGLKVTGVGWGNVALRRFNLIREQCVMMKMHIEYRR